MVWITLEHIGVTGSEQTTLKIVAHINKFYEMFPVADVVAEIVRESEGAIGLGLPKPC